MFGRILEKILNTSLFKTMTIIGGIGGIKYGYDSIEDLLQKNKNLFDQEQIDKIVLTDKDKESLQKYSDKPLSDIEMKELKYVILKKREQQKLNKKLKKYDLDFNNNLGDNLNKENLKPKSKD